MMKVLAVAVVAALLVTEGFGQVEEDQKKFAMLRSHDSTFAVSSDTNTIRIAQTTTKATDEPKETQPKSSTHISSTLNRIMRDEIECDDNNNNSTTTTKNNNNNCVVHKKERNCVLDVSCGWCVLPTGGYCVDGTPSGPVDNSVNCPVYLTYQTELPPVGPVDDLFSDKDDNQKNNNNAPSVDFNFDEIQTNDPNNNMDEIDDNKNANPFPNPEPDQRSRWGMNEKEAMGDEGSPNHHSFVGVGAAVVARQQQHQRQQQNTNSKAPIPLVMDPIATSKFDSGLSPCGLPGVPPFVCQTWIKLHCGPDQMTSDVIRNGLNAANNGYDWCKTAFEFNPPAYGPGPKPFPWFINNQRVPDLPV